jgi:arylsulfatase
MHCLTALALATLALAASFASAAEQPAQRPNVLIILADDMGWSDIGAFGSEISTPHIDRLAGDGVKFTQFYNTARCCPTRASLLTGLYPHQAGVGHMLWPTGYPGYATRMSRDAVTIAEVLKDAGYGTYMTGKWHLAERVADPKKPVGWPLDRGFDKFYGTLAGYGSFYDPATLCRDNTYITPQNDPEYRSDDFYYTDAISDNAVQYLKNHAAADWAKPFFLYVAYTAAHWPIQAPEGAIAPYKGKYDAGYDAIRQQRIAKLKQLGLMPPVTEPAPTTGEWETVKDKAYEARRMEAYAGMISRMDEGIGRIIAHLRASGALDNTLILYLHDNGGCDEEFFHNNQRPPQNVHVMAADELQSRTLPPMQTRDGQVVKTGEGVMAGPATSFLGYGPAWANVSNTPLRLVKKNAHEGGISTPLIVHWPAAARGSAGKIVSAPSHLIDLMPTIVEVTAAEYPRERAGHTVQPLEGESLLPLITGSGRFERGEPLFWEHEGNRAVRDGRWKLVAEENKPWELYDMNIDRGEMNNLAEKHPDRVKQMAAAWQAYADRARVQPFGAHRLRKRAPEPQGAPRQLRGLSGGDVRPRNEAPALSDAGIHITARIGTMDPDGVIVAQGAEQHGYAIYLQNGRAHFIARRAGQLCKVSSRQISGADARTITARLERDGRATLQVGDEPPATADFFGPLLETPADGLSVGFDDGNPVGEYPARFPFRGEITAVDLEILRKGHN